MIRFFQRGAMFGLDARITLIIFGTLTLVSGYVGLKAFSLLRAQSFTTELRSIAKATAQFTVDMSLNPNDAIVLCPSGPIICGSTDYENAFFALTRTDDLSSTNHWHGPYITYTAKTQQRFGVPRIYALDADYGACAAGETCYNWLYLPAFVANSQVIDQVNASFDGTAEVSANTSGHFRYVDNGNGTFVIMYRMGRSL